MSTETNHSTLPQPDAAPREPTFTPLPAVRFLPPRLVPLLPKERRDDVRDAAADLLRRGQAIMDRPLDAKTLMIGGILAASALATLAGTVALLACAEDEDADATEGGA